MLVVEEIQSSGVKVDNGKQKTHLNWPNIKDGTKL